MIRSAASLLAKAAQTVALLTAPALTLGAALLLGAMPTQAMSLLGPDLATFAVLGASPVTNVPISAVGGNVGVWSSGGANAITGFLSAPFLGNILALASITMHTDANEACGRVLTSNGAVTLDQNKVSRNCLGILAGSDGLGGGLDVVTSLAGAWMSLFCPSCRWMVARRCPSRVRCYWWPSDCWVPLG